MSYHSMRQAWAVVNETKRILEAEQKPVAATAHASKPKPATATASVRWAAAVAAKVATGLPRAAAVRAVSIEQPGLQAEYVAQFNAKSRQVEDLEREVSRLAAASR